MNVSVFTSVTLHRMLVLPVFIMLALMIVPAQAVEKGFADLAERLMPAVVNVSITTTVSSGGSVMQGSPFEEFFEDFMDRQNGAPNKNNGKKEVTSVGSGFVIDPKGIIVTNNHVIEKAEKITVNFSNGDKYDATLVGRDAKTDIAVLKVDAPKDLPSVRFGDSQKARVGEWVIAIGNPFGLGGSLSAGVISAINRDINSGPYDSFIQTDAAINKGNSGGPLFNMDGEVIGVNTAIISPTGGSVGIGFSIPADMAQTVINQLLEFGETRRGWLGVRIQTVTDELAEGLGMSKPKGALIAEIIEDGPADKAGLKQGDVILRFNNKEVAEMRDLPRIVAETGINKKVQVEVLRRGKIVRKSVTVGRLDESEQKDANAAPAPQDQPVEKDVAILGMHLEPLTDAARDRAGMGKDDAGVLIAKVAPNSAAALAGLRGGNVIAELDQEQVNTPDDVVQLVKQARKDDKKSVLVLLKTPNGLRFIALKVEEKQ
ncbi:MAG: DegQ family serine endoprotease [Parvibaculales bacterium]